MQLAKHLCVLLSFLFDCIALRLDFGALLGFILLEDTNAVESVVNDQKKERDQDTNDIPRRRLHKSEEAADNGELTLVLSVNVIQVYRRLILGDHTVGGTDGFVTDDLFRAGVLILDLHDLADQMRHRLSEACIGVGGGEGDNVTNVQSLLFLIRKAFNEDQITLGEIDAVNIELGHFVILVYFHGFTLNDVKAVAE